MNEKTRTLKLSLERLIHQLIDEYEEATGDEILKIKIDRFLRPVHPGEPSAAMCLGRKTGLLAITVNP